MATRWQDLVPPGQRVGLRQTLVCHGVWRALGNVGPAEIRAALLYVDGISEENGPRIAAALGPDWEARLPNLGGEELRDVCMRGFLATVNDAKARNSEAGKALWEHFKGVLKGGL